ncbi:MAG TPA: ABC transporter substrate-binding protein [Alphaproteobacteria bacterium]|nr:ABC transporter substrate-binding protein [Alphaproteobacteria bacterium]
MTLLRTLRAVALSGGVLALAFTVGQAAAQETKELRIAKQFGVSYLPLTVIEERKLIEKHAKSSGLGDIKVEWSRLSAGAPMNDALLSGSLDVAAGGVGPLVTIWARTKGNLNVKAISAINSMPIYLNTINPDVTSLKDFTDKDRIALPAVKVSIQAVTLQMAAEKEFGPGKHDVLDKLTVSMAHPDGMSAMMSGRSEITAHFSSAPFQYQQLEDQRVRRVVSSYEVLGGPATFNLVWTTQKFHDENPRTYRAVLDALEEAMIFINSDRRRAAELWVKAENSRLPVQFVEKILKDPENVFTLTPNNVMKYVEFMSRVGSIKVKPDSWKDLFFPEVHEKLGS